MPLQEYITEQKHTPLIDKYASGLSAKKIAATLTLEGIPSPKKYAYEKLGFRGRQGEHDIWCPATILCSLLAQREKAQKSLNNLLKAIEEGILTATTKTRMTELEEQIALLDIKIKGETQKEEQVITKDQVIAYLRNIAKYEPRFLINVFVKEVVLYNDKIEIYYYYTDKKGSIINVGVRELTSTFFV